MRCRICSKTCDKPVCDECNASRNNNGSLKAPQPSYASREAKKYCPGCYKEISFKMDCTNCGWKYVAFDLLDDQPFRTELEAGIEKLRVRWYQEAETESFGEWCRKIFTTLANKVVEKISV